MFSPGSRRPDTRHTHRAPRRSPWTARRTPRAAVRSLWATGFTVGALMVPNVHGVPAGSTPPGAPVPVAAVRGVATAPVPGVPSGLRAAARAEGLSIGRATLTGSHTGPGNEFGVSVAISGTTAVAGAYEHGGGAAYVFTERAGAWREQAALAPSKPGFEFFGWSVAISGATIAVGSVQVGEPGRVYVFTRHGTAWSQTADLQASDGVPEDQFGAAVALSGNTMVIGAPGGNWTNNKAYVFTEHHGRWAQAAELTASDGLAYDNFGRAVALSGKTIVIGAPGRQGQVGAAYVFTGSGGDWAQQAELTGQGEVGGGQFGASVAVLGPTVLIGAPHDDNFIGSVYVFTESGGTWAQRLELPGPIPSPVSFGSGIALERGTAVVITEAGPLGRAFVYQGGRASWTLVHHLSGPAGSNGFFGSAALSGRTAVIGVPSLNRWTGAAYVFGPLPGARTTRGA